MTLNPLASVFRRCAFAMLSTRSSSVNTGITKSSTPLQNMPHESESFQSVGGASPSTSVEAESSPNLAIC
jgi:hypothetical protein